jgi:hypothetical protein
VWRQEDGFWRWRYHDPVDGTTLLSNESHPERHRAVHAAAVAYPMVPVVDAHRPPLTSTAKRSLWAALLGGVLAMAWLFVVKLVRLAVRFVLSRRP